MRTKLIVAGLLTAGLCLASWAGDGIPVGNAVFYPSIEGIYTSTDNLYMVDSSMQGGDVSDEFWIIRPSLGIEIPFNESFIRMDVGYQYKDYNHYNLSDHNSYHFDFKGLFKLSNGAKLTFNNHVIRGVQEVNEFDPGYERVFGDTPFVREDAKIGLELPVNQRNELGFYGLYNQVHFTGGAYQARPFYNYEQSGGGLTWKYATSPTSSWLLDGRYIDSSPNSERQDVLLHTAMQKHYHQYDIVTGWEGNHKDIMSGSIKVGYSKMDFTNNDYSNFHGLIGDATLGFQPAKEFKIDFVASRHPYQSTYNINNYYTATVGQLQLQQEVTHYFFWTAGYRYQENGYPDKTRADVYGPGNIPTTLEFLLTQGELRKDKISRMYGEVGFHFTKQFSVRLNYRHEDRESNIDYHDVYGILRKPYSYTENRFSVQGSLAW